RRGRGRARLGHLSPRSLRQPRIPASLRGRPPRRPRLARPQDALADRRGGRVRQAGRPRAGERRPGPHLPDPAGAAVKTFVIAGTQSGVGKTTIAAGLMAALARRGHSVQGFKVGPDYIDPSYHERATGRASRNLDLWMCSPSVVRESYARAAADVNVVE